MAAESERANELLHELHWKPDRHLKPEADYVQTIVERFCWGKNPDDLATVDAELERRGYQGTPTEKLMLYVRVQLRLARVGGQAKFEVVEAQRLKDLAKPPSPQRPGKSGSRRWFTTGMTQ